MRQLHNGSLLLDRQAGVEMNQQNACALIKFLRKTHSMHGQLSNLAQNYSVS